MAKQRSVFVCQECGAAYPRLQANCYHCNAWNTIVEEIPESASPFAPPPAAAMPAIPLPKISFQEFNRVKTGISEFDRVTGGGIVPGSLVLIGGSPGIGKSTLLLSAADRIASSPDGKGGKVLYITGEESLGQIKMRADRLGVKSDNLVVLAEIDMAKILATMTDVKPDLVIVDSIQTMMNPAVESAPGSVSQVRECAALLQRFSKTAGIPVVIVGHITRSGSIAGPMVLEHIVDAVLFFEGEGVRDYRILRALKNRFGSTQEIGVFLMESTGLRCVENPSEFFLSQRTIGTSGSVVVPVLEGSRTLLIEVQALVTQSGFGMPARRAEGISVNRVTLLLAVMEKRAKMLLGGSDVFLNVVGGVEIGEPAADLAIVLAVASSLRDKPLAPGTCAIGEVGLGGEIRGVTRVEERVREAARMGFEQIILPSGNITDAVKSVGVKLLGVDTITEALNRAFK